VCLLRGTDFIEKANLSASKNFTSCLSENSTCLHYQDQTFNARYSHLPCSVRESYCLYKMHNFVMLGGTFVYRWAVWLIYAVWFANVTSPWHFSSLRCVNVCIGTDSTKRTVLRLGSPENQERIMELFTVRGMNCREHLYVTLMSRVAVIWTSQNGCWIPAYNVITERLGTCEAVNWRLNAFKAFSRVLWPFG
jgi:hypothetical protein